MTFIHFTPFIDDVLTDGVVGVCFAADSDLYPEGILTEQAAARVLEKVLAPLARTFDGLSLTYCSAAGVPLHYEFFEFHLRKGACARSSVYLKDGTRMFRSQRTAAAPAVIVDLATS